MTEKVKIPKEVCDALDELLETYPYKNRPDYIIRDLYLNDKLFEEYTSFYNFNSIIDIMRALVLGYEPELTAEEQIKYQYDMGFDMSKHQFAYRAGIRDTLKIHGIHYDWLET